MDMKELLRVGLVGTGTVALDHLRGYRQNARCKVAAVADVNSERGQTIAHDHGAAFYSDYGVMLKEARLDAVSVCLPHQLHYAAGMACAAAGAHVLMEKPIALTLAEADSLLEEFEKRRLLLTVGFAHRFRPEFQEAERLIKSGALGTPANALDRLCTLGGKFPPSWVWDRGLAGGGILIWTGIHTLDRLRWLFASEPERVFAAVSTYAHKADVEDGIAGVIEFANGAMASINENSPPYGKLGEWTTEVFGNDGAIQITTGTGLDYVGIRGRYSQRFLDTRHFEAEIDEFIDAILSVRSPAISGWDGRQALAMTLALYESARTHRAVIVPR